MKRYICLVCWFLLILPTVLVGQNAPSQNGKQIGNTRTLVDESVDQSSIPPDGGGASDKKDSIRKTPKQNKYAATQNEVMIGKPIFIPYSRAFALLDGLFQDVSAMQIKQLNLDANGANASRVDAISQQFNAGVNFSQLAGIQNAAAAQQSRSFSRAMAFETQLINQESQLINLVARARQEMREAQIAFDNASDEEKNSAKARLESAKVMVDMIDTQIKSVKELRQSTALSNNTGDGSFTSVNPNTAPTPASMPMDKLNPSAKDSGISFPASKQMENQVNLIWERLAHLMSTLAQSETKGNVHLVKFNTSITVGKNRKKSPLLSTQYGVSCGEWKKGTKDKVKPIILDLFPRMAAVNIADQKYRNNRFGLEALLSFFSVGFNASYNREHLRMTQSLSQSAYITGFGIQSDTFGWIFGPTLGEDIPAPGTRSTFALISMPEGCAKAEIDLKNAVWGKSPQVIGTSETGYMLPEIDGEVDITGKEVLCVSENDCVERISYTPVEFISGTPIDKRVTISIRLKNRLDREQLVSLNGTVLKRARDHFGRATSSAANIPLGLLQSTTLDNNTWFPVSDREMILILDPSDFADQFPRIVITSSRGTIDITNNLKKANLVIGGKEFMLDPDAIDKSEVLPAPGRPTATRKNFSAEVWEVTSGKEFLIYFKDKNFVNPDYNLPKGSLNSVQIIDQSKQEPWSSSARVMAKTSDGNNSLLNCEPHGHHLKCSYPKYKYDNRTIFEIFDVGYEGGGVKGGAILQECQNSAQCGTVAVILELKPVGWSENSNSWELSLNLVAHRKLKSILLDGIRKDIDLTECVDIRKSCEVKIKIDKSKIGEVSNLMSLVFENDNGGKERKKIGYLKDRISPIIYSIDDDKVTLRGVNLVWDTVKLGSGKEIALDCPTSNYCIASSELVGKGFLYVYDHKRGMTPILLRKLTEDGLEPVSAIKPSKPDKDKNKDKPKSEKKPDKKLSPDVIQLILQNNLQTVEGAIN